MQELENTNSLPDSAWGQCVRRWHSWRGAHGVGKRRARGRPMGHRDDELRRRVEEKTGEARKKREEEGPGLPLRDSACTSVVTRLWWGSDQNWKKTKTCQFTSSIIPKVLRNYSVSGTALGMGAHIWRPFPFHVIPQTCPVCTETSKVSI